MFGELGRAADTWESFQLVTESRAGTQKMVKNHVKSICVDYAHDSLSADLIVTCAHARHHVWRVLGGKRTRIEPPAGRTGLKSVIFSKTVLVTRYFERFKTHRHSMGGALRRHRFVKPYVW